ncbi:MAG: Ig domain-containing protein [Gemmataceae bacterium]|nr:Ig domain-containing protein [Gemmataceae bacterium]
MSTRERLMAVVLSVLIVAGVAGAAGYFLVYEPVGQKTAAADQLQKDIDDLTAKRNQFAKDRKRLDESKRRSLPPDEALARREYNEMLSRLLRRAGAPAGFTVTPLAAPADRNVPTLPGKKPAYTKLATSVEFRKADLWAVREFLEGYYRLNLLHQITGISVKREDETASAGTRTKAAPDRKDLTVKLTTEAIILDGAEPRMTLLPVSAAFAAAGGQLGYSAVAHTPEAGRGLTPLQLAPVLAARNRDYSFLAMKDMFHGPLPPPAPLKVEKIAEVAVKAGEAVPAVTVPLAGDLDYLGNVTLSATADGTFLPPDAITVDQAARTLTFAPPAGRGGSATVTVVARSETGQEAKGSFKLTVAPPKPKEDIAAAIVLTGVTTASDGTAEALIRDNANKFKYQIDATRRRVKVTKFFYTEGTNVKKKDADYDTPDELVISDEKSSTSRRFKVVALDEEGLVVQDLQPAEAPAPKPADKPKGGGKGPREKDPAEADPPAPAKAGSDAPVAAPTLYRWAAGKSLAGLVKLPADEAERILRRSAEAGPVGATALAVTRE